MPTDGKGDELSPSDSPGPFMATITTDRDAMTGKIGLTYGIWKLQPETPTMEVERRLI